RLETAASDSLTQVFEVDGIRAILRKVLTNDVVAVNLYLLGGARQIDERTAGIEPLLLRSSRGGTRDYPGSASLEAEARTGSRMLVSAGPDWTVFGFRGLVEQFDSTWALFTNRLMYPSLDSTAVELARSKLLRNARAAEDDPDFMVRSLAASLAFAGHPYVNDVGGTVTSLSGITIEDLRAYLDEQIVRSRMLLVIVGDIPREQVEAAVRATLGELPLGDYTWELPPTWAGDSTAIRVQQRQLPSNYILGYIAGPHASSEEYADFRVAVAVLSGIVHGRIREEGLSYAAGAWVLDRAAAGGAVYVSTTDPDESVRIINSAIDRLQGDYFRGTTLERWAKGSVIDYYVNSETNQAQADILARAYLYRRKLATADDYVDELRGVEPHDVRGAAERYFKNIQFAFLGDPDAVPERLTTGSTATDAPVGQTVTDYRQIRLYTTRRPQCPYVVMHPIEVWSPRDASDLQRAVFNAGGDGAIRIEQTSRLSAGRVEYGWKAVVIRFTDSECTY
ncbi:MAG: pitrilysin family protein, partial [Gemmatimonadales bacterium]